MTRIKDAIGEAERTINRTSYFFFSPEGPGVVFLSKQDHPDDPLPLMTRWHMLAAKFPSREGAAAFFAEHRSLFTRRGNPPWFVGMHTEAVDFRIDREAGALLPAQKA